MGVRKEYNVQNPRLPEFTKRFRALVDKYGGTTNVVKLTGISGPTINFWYNGKRTPDATNLAVLSKTLGVSADWLLGLVDENNESADLTKKRVSDYSGLSSTAVSMLHGFAENARGNNENLAALGRLYLETVNTMIEAENEEPLLMALHEYLFREKFSYSLVGSTSEMSNKIALHSEDVNGKSGPKYSFGRSAAKNLLLLEINDMLSRIRAKIQRRDNDGKH